MHQLSTPSRKKNDFGWSIQLYSGDRRLLFCLYPSHAWLFVIGLFLGYVIPFLGLGANHQITEPSPPSESAQPAILQVD